MKLSKITQTGLFNCPLDNSIKEEIEQNKIMYIMRGPSGAGKSTLANELVGNGTIVSADQYPGLYGENGEFNSKLLGSAHSWAQNRAKEAAEKGISPIVIDNTNLQFWELKSYVQIGMNFKYRIEIREPKTTWKFDPQELAKKTVHLPKDKAQQISQSMVDRYQPAPEGEISPDLAQQILTSKSPFKR